MAENTAVVEKKEAESRELVAKDFTEGMVVKIKQKEKFGLTFPKDYNYTNEFMSAMLILQDTVDMNKSLYCRVAQGRVSKMHLLKWLRTDFQCRRNSATRLLMMASYSVRSQCMETLV